MAESDRLDGDLRSDSIGDLADVGAVGRDDRVASADGSFDDGDVDDVVVVCLAGEDADGLGVSLIQWLE